MTDAAHGGPETRATREDSYTDAEWEEIQAHTGQTERRDGAWQNRSPAHDCRRNDGKGIRLRAAPTPTEGEVETVGRWNTLKAIAIALKLKRDEEDVAFGTKLLDHMAAIETDIARQRWDSL